MLTDCKVCGIPHFRSAEEYNHEYDPVVPDWDDSDKDEEFDPDETLSEIRRLIDEYNLTNDDRKSTLLADDITEHFSMLDEWLSNGGFKPRAWSRTRIS